MSDNLDTVADSYQSKPCRVCAQAFTPPRSAGALSTDDNHTTLCPSCRRAVKDANLGNELPSEGPVLHNGLSAAPMRQIVFDLETWGLDRGWGVTLVASFLIHGGPEGPKRITLKHRDTAAWKAGKRSDDHEMAEEVFRILGNGAIAYAHNGDRFDVPWLRTVALKYGLQMPRLKLVDPCQIAWKKYRLGRNSLEAVANFLQLKQSKLHLSPETWREALMDDDDAAWDLLVERCISDVDLLNAVAGRVTGDVGMIDFQGSWR